MPQIILIPKFLLGPWEQSQVMKKSLFAVKPPLHLLCMSDMALALQGNKYSWQGALGLAMSQSCSCSEVLTICLHTMFICSPSTEIPVATDSNKFTHHLPGDRGFSFLRSAAEATGKESFD